MRTRFPSAETRQKMRNTSRNREQVRITPETAPPGFFNWRISAFAIERELEKRK